MYDKVYVYWAEESLISLGTVEGEIPYGSRRVYFNPSSWRKITDTVNTWGIAEEQLRFFDSEFHELKLLAPHNQIRFVCEFVSSTEPVKRMSLEEAEKLTEDRSEDLSEVRKRGGCVHRQELDNRPQFHDWAGPMWDGVRENGTAVIRYERWDVYERMCD